MNNQDGTILCRKTDPDLNRICPTNSQDIFITGADKVLKRYKYPDENLQKMDLKIKLPAPSPIEEIESHQLPTTCIQYDKEWIVSGS